MLRGSNRVLWAIGLTVILLLSGCDLFNTFDPNRNKPIVVEGAIAGTLYPPALRIVNRYCADCHTQGGNNRLQHDAWKYALRLDTYAEWVDARKVLLERLVPETAAAQDPPVDVMPNLSFLNQPTQAERDTLLTWIRAGSRNTVSGL